MNNMFQKKNTKQITSQVIELHNKSEEQFIPGLTMPSGIPVLGNIIAWDDYVRTLAYQQLSTLSRTYVFEEIDFGKIINYFRSTPQKMQVFLLLYLVTEDHKMYSIKQMMDILSVSKSGLVQILDNTVEAGWVEKEKAKYYLSQIAFNAFRHYGANHFEENRKTNLAGQFYRVLHSTTQKNTDSKMRTFTGLIE